MERKMTAVVMGLGLILGLGSSIGSASAAEPVAAAPSLDDRVKALEEKSASSVQVSGFVDVYYSLNFDHPAPAPGVFGNQAMRAFDVQADKFSLNVAELVFQKAPGSVPVGFRVDLDFGPGTDIVHAVEPGGVEVYKNVQQAYVTYVAPLGKGLTIDFGKFVTHMGNEVIESQNNWNYSRGLLFTWAIPFYHAGARVTLPVADSLTVTLLGVNGWNNVASANAGKDVGAEIVFTGIPKVTIVGNGIWGSFAADGFRRDVYDLIVTVTPTEKFSIAANADFGHDDCLSFTTPGGGCGAPGNASWYGLAGYLRYAFTDAAAMAGRAEWYKDPDGTTTGVAQTLAETTVTGEYKIGSALLTRLEYRHDWSNQNTIFNGGTEDTQDTLTLGVVYSF
jgi:hypothetical protein